MPQDRFRHHASSRTSPGSRHWPITPLDGAPLDPRPRALYCAAAGTAVLRDAEGRLLSYSLDAGDLLAFSACGVEASGTSATLYGWD